MHVSDAFTHHLIKIRIIKDLQRVFQRKPRQLSKEFNHTSIFHLKDCLVSFHILKFYFFRFNKA